MAEGPVPAKSGFFRSVLGSIVELDDKPKSTTPPPPASINVVAPSAAIAGSTVPQVDADMLAALNKVVGARKTAYTSLLEKANKFEAIIPDVGQRFKAAFVSTNDDGQRSIADINQAIDMHLRDLDGELIRFKGSSDRQLVTKVNALRTEAAALANTAAEAQKKIEQLKNDIAALEQNIQSASGKASALQTEANQAEADVKSVTAAFEAAVETSKNTLLTSKTTLATFLA